MDRLFWALIAVVNLYGIWFGFNVNSITLIVINLLGFLASFDMVFEGLIPYAKMYIKLKHLFKA